MSTLPIGLTDSQLKILFDLSRPLNVRERGRFMELVERLRGHAGEIGSGTISQIARAAQKQVFRPPIGAQEEAPLIEIVNKGYF